MCNRHRPRREWLGWTAVLWMLLLVRACAAGVSYWPQLDDYIQMHNYLLSFSSFSALQKTVGVLDTRPLAGLADYFVWGRMFSFLLLGVAVVSLLYAAAVLMWAVLGRFFRVGTLFPVVVVLLPLGVEGTYWMSAATRVAVGMFWAALAAWLFFKWLDTSKLWALTSFFACQLLPFGFYEQAGIFAVALTTGLAILCGSCQKEHRKKCVLGVLWPPVSMVLYLLLTKLLSGGGVYSSRSVLMLPTTPGYFEHFLPDILGQIRTVFFNADFYILTRGVLRTVRELLAGELILWFVLMAALCVLIWMLGRSVKIVGEGGKLSLQFQFLIGLVLAAAPVTLFLILDNPWFSLRGAVTSFPGLALLADGIVETAWRGIKAPRSVPAVLAALCALIFSMAGASEVLDYRDNYLADQRAASAVLTTMREDLGGYEDVKHLTVGILGMEPTFLPQQNYHWHEHITGCTESGWAFSGLVRSMVGEMEELPSLTPLPSSPLYRRWNAEANRPDRFDLLYYYNEESLEPVTLERTGEKNFNVLRADGTLLGHIWEEPDGTAYFEGERS